ncbi:hypothetical protein SAMN05444169_4908 [Bradyrhizobium erythrophlei]|uniref:Uncharacterized protein n=1 Tax=Bradyrhizobium erythrophlei TaxID=1437360 RepID=A0A1M5NYP6_9BRAD|nr:hypothetical protein SAMN05444169_4908 [Bradyrhizobium erythrophlei]
MSVDAPAEVAVIDMERSWRAKAWPYLKLSGVVAQFVAFTPS